MSEQEVIDFTSTLPQPLLCVVKPNDSAGSDSVFKCTYVCDRCVMCLY